MIEILAALSASAAAGMRIALPLLVIALLYGDRLWYKVAPVSNVSPRIILGILVIWSLTEVVISKDRLGRRFLQIVELIFSPLVGAILGMVVAQIADCPIWLIVLLGLVGGLLALVLQLVQTGWSYRLRNIPLWIIFAQDALCVLLVLFALDAPRQGGLIALLLLWLAIRSSKEWHRWYTGQTGAAQRHPPRQGRQKPD